MIYYRRTVYSKIIFLFISLTESLLISCHSKNLLTEWCNSDGTDAPANQLFQLQDLSKTFTNDSLHKLLSR